MKRLFVIVFIFIGLFYSYNYSFYQKKHPQKIQYELDYARYQASNGYTYLEIYFAISRANLEHLKDGDVFTAKSQLQVNFFSNDSLIHSHSWKMLDQVESLEEIKKEQYLYDQYSIFLKEGDYVLKVKVQDLNRNLERSYDKNIEIVNFSDSVLQQSDIQLALKIVPVTTKGKFVKNRYQILPNPTGMYSLDWPLLYYYSEIYNLSPKSMGDDSTYSVKVSISDINGDIVKKLPPKVKKRKGKSIVEIGRVNVATLISSPYQLRLTVIDNATGDSISNIKNFFVLRPSDITRLSQTDKETELGISDEYSTMSEAALDLLFEQANYIATKEEKKIYKNLDLQGKRKFMPNFWRQRDFNKATEHNEYKAEYLKRVTTANSRYSAGSKQGWQTDQGRVLILYGEPDRIDRHHTGMIQHPYHIWYYDSIEGGVEFVFCDLGYGEYRLVHSTARNEIQDYGWQNRWLR